MLYLFRQNLYDTLTIVSKISIILKKLMTEPVLITQLY